MNPLPSNSQAPTVECIAPSHHASHNTVLGSPRKMLWIASSLLLITAIGVQSATEFRSRRAAFMRQKMAYNQALLEGLTLGKFDEVTKNSIRLRDMSAKDMWFNVSDGKKTWQSASPEFKAATTQFAQEVDGVFLAATAKDLKKATEAYKRVIDSCVQCHAQFRVEQMRATPPVR